MSWFYLALAGGFEIAWALGLKASNSFTRPLPSMVTLACMAMSFWLLALALRHLPLGTAYVVWTGIGAVGAFLFGAMLFGESVNALRVASMTLVVAGIIGLKLSTG